MRTDLQRLLGEGKTVKILTVGKKGREQLKRDYAEHFIDHVDLSEVKRIGFANAAGIGRDVLARFDAGEFDVATLYYSRFKSVLTQEPQASRSSPPRSRRSRARLPTTNTSRARRRSSPTCCRAMSASRSSPRCWRTPRRSRARG